MNKIILTDSELDYCKSEGISPTKFAMAKARKPAVKNKQPVETNAASIAESLDLYADFDNEEKLELASELERRAFLIRLEVKNSN